MADLNPKCYRLPGFVPLNRFTLIVAVSLVTAPAAADYNVSVAGFRDLARARTQAETARYQTGRPFNVQMATVPDGVVYRVVTGPMTSRSEARAVAEELETFGYAGAWVVPVDANASVDASASVEASPEVPELDAATATSSRTPGVVEPTLPGPDTSPDGYTLNQLPDSTGPVVDDTVVDGGGRPRGPVGFGTNVTFDSAVDKEGTAQKSQVTVLPHLELTLGRIDIKGVGRLRYDAEDRLEPGQPQQAAIDDFTPRFFFNDDTEAELRELFADFSVGDASFRVGKQAIVWGQADGLKVLDLVNPQSFREFILEDFSDSRIPLWSASVERPVGPGSLQLLLIADQTYHEMPEPGALFEFTAHLADLPSSLPVRIEAPAKPSDRFSDADAGLRYAVGRAGWSLTFNYLYHYDDFAVMRQTITPTQVILSPTYERSHVLGGAASKPYDDYVIRLEYVFASDRFYQAATASGVARSDQFSSVLGLDWSGLANTKVSAQFFQSTALDHDSTFNRTLTEMNASLLLKRHWWNAALSAELMVIHGLSGQGALVRSALTLNRWNNVQIRLYADLFEGDSRDLFGQFDQRDRAGLAVTVDLF